MNKELLQRADMWYQTSPLSIQEPISSFIAGAKEILDNPELYGLVKKDLYDELDAFHNDLHSEYSTLQIENKELKEKIIELETVIAKLSQKVILYECNY